MKSRAILLKEKAFLEDFYKQCKYEAEFGLYHPNSKVWHRLHEVGGSVELPEPIKEVAVSLLEITEQKLGEIYKQLGLK